MARGPGEREVWRRLNGHEGESRIQIKADLELPLAVSGGQGVHREMESEGHEEKYRAVIKGSPSDDPVGQRWVRSSPHHAGEGVLMHPPYQGDCGRHGTEEQRVTSRGLTESLGGT